MPENYFQTLKVGHQFIVEALSEVQPFLRSYPEAKPRLRALSESLAVFLGHQDKRMFDALYDFYKNDRPSTKMIDFLLHDLKDLKIKYLIFFDKHSGEVLSHHKNSFPKDFMDFQSQVLGRLKIEEEYLFPLLKRWRNKPKLH
ncbi:MAG: hypothetical protein P9M07_06005 [Candidatus Aceula meridiana]|nr:hypothetical protein [Candidatus Aceula meridiana]